MHYSPRMIMIVAILSMFEQPIYSQWIQADGPYGGTVNSILTVQGTIFCGTQGGVFRSTNKGASWDAVKSGLTPNIGFTITKIGGNIYAFGSGIFRSSNNGGSWIALNWGIDKASLYIYELTTLGSSLFVGTNDGVYRSTDNGENWTLVKNGMQLLNPSNILVSGLATDGINLYAGTSDGLFRSSDNGANWEQCNTGIKQDYMFVSSIYNSDSQLFASISYYALYSSIDHGANWNLIYPGKFDENIRSIISSGNEIYIGTSFGGVYYSSDNGLSWTVRNNGLVNTNVSAVYADGNDLYAGTDAGIYRSTNKGISWTQIHNGIINTNVSALFKSGSNILAGTFDGIFRLSDQKTGWEFVTQNLTNVYAWDFANIGNTIIAGSSQNGIFRSTDEGLNWTKVSSKLNDTRPLISFGTKFFTGTFNGLYSSTDNGVSWDSVMEGYVNSFTIVGTDLIASISGGIYKYNNDKNVWNQIYQQPQVDITSLITVGDNIYGRNSDNTFNRSTDHGNSWNLIGNFPNAVYFEFLKTDGKYLFAGGQGCGVYFSKDGGFNWIQINSGLGHLIVFSLLIDGDYLYAGTFGGGVYKRKISEIVNIVNNFSSDISTDFRLEQNFPNPFNPTTTILYSVKSKSFISIKVFDMIGREIRTLVEQEKEPGNYQIVFDGNKLASGVYIYEMQAGNFRQIKKLLLLK